MIKHLWKIMLRGLVRQKTYTVITLGGLSIALSATFLLAIFVHHELSYDAFHPSADRIYRIGREVHLQDNIRTSAYTPVPLGPALKRDIAELEEVVRFWRAFQPVVRSADRSFRERGFYFADPAVFDMFSFPFVQGDPATALLQPNSVVLTESMARKYFGDADPMGKVLSYEGYPAGQLQMSVSGIIQDLPSHSQFAFDALASIVGVGTEAENWGSSKPIWTYALLRPQATRSAVETKLEKFLDTYYQSSATTLLRMEPLLDVHLYSRFGGGFSAPGDIDQIYVLSSIGVLILLLACVNSVNLALARALRRGREVGLRKTLGADRRQLIGLFMGEATGMVLISAVFAAILAQVALPLVNDWFGLGLAPGAFDAFMVLGGLGVLVFVSAIVGGYPALVMSASGSVPAHSGMWSGSPAGKARFRSTLVVFQFIVSIALIIGTLIIREQLEYIRGKDLGFDKDLLVVLPFGGNEETIVNRLEARQQIRAVTVSQRVPVNDVNGDGRTVRIGGSSQTHRVESYIVDERFVPTFRMDLVAGTSFSTDRPSDAENYVINETAARTFGWERPSDALGAQLTWSGSRTGRIIGVIRDFHTTSLREDIQSLVLLMMPEETYWKTFVTIRISPDDIPGTLQYVASAWQELAPQTPFNYFFVDESLEQLHSGDVQFGRTVTAFGMLAIFIACMGLFGLAAFSAEQRTREVGIRKVLGASVGQVVVLLCRDLLGLVAIANVIAWPLAYLAMERWLQGFSYRAEPTVWIFTSGALLVLLLGLLTVGSRAVIAARSNPVESLRHE